MNFCPLERSPGKKSKKMLEKLRNVKQIYLIAQKILNKDKKGKDENQETITENKNEVLGQLKELLLKIQMINQFKNV